MVTRAELTNNQVLSRNVGVWSQQFPNSRALVLDRAVADLENLAVKDYYNIIILETTAALVSVPKPDFLILIDPSPYDDDGVLTLNQYFGNSSTIFCTNYQSIIEYKKFKRPLQYFNSNYLPSSSNSSTVPGTARKTVSGLNQIEPGVHLALILGCTDIQYTGTSSSATKVGFTEIKNFIEERTRFAPANLVGIDRPTVLENL